MSQISLLIESPAAQAEERGSGSLPRSLIPLPSEAVLAIAVKARKNARAERDASIFRRTGAATQPQITKADRVLKKLRLSRGTTVAQIMEVTGWQAHSVRGFFSAIVKKRLSLNLASEVGKDGQRRYRVVESLSRDAGNPR